MEFIGIQIDKPYLRVAVIDKSRRGIEIRALKSALLTDCEDVKQLYRESKKGRMGTGLSSKDFLIRPLEVKASESKHLEEAISFQSEATSHIDPAEILTVPLIKKKREGSTEALLFNASREALKTHLSEMEAIGIDPDTVSSFCSALCRFVQWKIPALQDAFIIDLGSCEWTCVWMEQGQLRRSHAISGGIEILLSSLWEDRKKILLQKEIEGVAKQIDLLQMKSHLNPHLSEKINEMRLELAKVLCSFHREAENKPLIFTGRIDAFGHFREFLVESFKDAICSECKGAMTPDEQKYAVSIGLAMESASAAPLQFRRDEFFPGKYWKRLAQNALILLTSSVCASAAIYNFASKETQSRKKEMIQFLGSSLDRWDPQLKKKIFEASVNEEEILEKWIHSVESHNKEYGYIPQSPKAAEFLSWLSAHPVIQSLKTEGDPIDIREIRYQLVQHPSLNSPQEPYLVKVELEFKVKEATHARKFHEALLKGDERVDPNLEITWEALSETYRTSFHLKNRSPHVP